MQSNVTVHSAFNSADYYRVGQPVKQEGNFGHFSFRGPENVYYEEIKPAKLKSYVSWLSITSVVCSLTFFKKVNNVTDYEGSHLYNQRSHLLWLVDVSHYHRRRSVLWVPLSLSRWPHVPMGVVYRRQRCPRSPLLLCGRQRPASSPTAPT